MILKVHCTIYFSHWLVHNRQYDAHTLYHALWTRCLQGYFWNQRTPLTPHDISGMMCGSDFPFKVQTSTSSWGAKRSCASVPIAWGSSNSSINTRIPSSTGTQQASDPLYPNSRTQLSFGALTSHLVWCETPDWPKGYWMNNLPFNLFKSLLLLRTPR